MFRWLAGFLTGAQSSHRACLCILFFFTPMISLAGSVTVPSNVVWRNQIGTPTGFYETHLEACIAAMPPPGNHVYSNPRAVDCPSYASSCDCLYDVENTKYGTTSYNWEGTNYVFRFKSCDGGLLLDPSVDGFPGACYGVVQMQGGPSCPAAGKPMVGNPIDPLTGNKYQRENDLVLPNGLSVIRHYNSRSRRNIGLGLSWTSNVLGKRLEFGADAILVMNDEGQIESWSKVNSVWIGDSDSTIQLVETGTGYEITRANDSLEVYDASGRILSLTYRNGLALTYTFNATTGFIQSVSNQYNEALQITTDELGYVTEILASNGEFVRYEYNENGLLAKALYSDDTPTNDTDNPTRNYQYTFNGNLYHALTSITDENSNVYASWVYDTQGRAISSEHANGVEQVTIDYSYINNGSDPRVTVTDVLGKQTTYHYTTINGARKVTQVEGHAALGCPAADQFITYDANGFVSSRTDFEGNVTTYINNARGLEISRTEASGTPEARTITTEWHATYRLPIKITEPGKETTFTYDSNGLLLTRTEKERP